jgi:predicted MFS family arabinose efflux permease
VRLYVLLAILALPLALVTKTQSTTLAIGLFSWAMFIAVAFIVTSLHLSARAYPREDTGLVAGIGSGAWSAVVAILSLLYGHWFAHEWYGRTFLSLSLVPVVGTALWWWIGRGTEARADAAVG